MEPRPYPPNQLKLRAADIQYLPHHHCPQCGALPRTTERGEWIRPYQDWFGTALSGWLDHLGYVSFQCDCRHHPQFRGSLRVARLGDAILPLHFADGPLARQAGLEPAVINAASVRQAVTFLAQQADPAFTDGSDRLTHLLYALAVGGISPEAARGEIQQLIDLRSGLALQPEQAARLAPGLVRLDLGSSLARS